MKRILVWFLILSFSVAAARAQDDATQQQINKLNGQIQDLLDAQAVQGKRIDALEKEISDLRDKASQPPPATDTASAADLKKLADQVQEIDRKRQEDRELILKEIEKLGKVSGSPAASHKAPPTLSTPALDNPTPAATGPQKGYEYKVAAGDTLSIIAKAYRDQGIKVTTDQILKANPGLNPNTIKVGQKIFIPAPAK
ncbi:MAG: LysM peptidoglycan-binding domain-containing protein [Verrucomicrobiia bacterium]|jgi:LysM repeat protein